MPRTIETQVYKFEELSDKAKEKARAWWRECENNDPYWQESVYDDAIECGKIIGIEIDRGDGVSSLRSSIYYSGFSSQGDGACFEGRYSYAKAAAKAIRKHAPVDATLHGIADDLQAVQARHFYKLEATMKHRGRYYHSGCMSVDVTHADTGNNLAGAHDKSGVYRPADGEEQITDCMRRFADWIYRQLEAEHDYRMSDENVDDAITANGYEFTEQGKRS